MDNFVNEPPPFAPINRSLLATDEILDPVPPSPVLNIPVIDESSNLSASLPLSIAKPPFDLVSMDNECATVSPDVVPVLAIPSPPVIVET